MFTVQFVLVFLASLFISTLGCYVSACMLRSKKNNEAMQKLLMLDERVHNLETKVCDVQDMNDVLLAGHIENIELLKEHGIKPKFVPDDLMFRGDQEEYNWDSVKDVSSIKKSRSLWFRALEDDTKEK